MVINSRTLKESLREMEISSGASFFGTIKVIVFFFYLKTAHCKIYGHFTILCIYSIGSKLQCYYGS